MMTTTTTRVRTRWKLVSLHKNGFCFICARVFLVISFIALSPPPDAPMSSRCLCGPRMLT